MAAYVPILTYHAVLDAARPTPLAVAPERFRAQLAALAGAGYETVPLSRLAELWRTGKRDGLPERAVVITFDDGYRSVIETVAPILREHGFTATLFLLGGREGLRWRPPWPLLTWDEAGQLAAAGHELGAHTLTHPVLPHLPPDEAEREMAEAQQVIARETGREARTLAYPFGARSVAVEALARRHFDAACGTRLGLAGPNSNLYDLERVDAYYLNPAGLAGRLETAPARAYLGARRALRWARRIVRPDWAAT
jgi:peptidoglycan/xylan/chitin deacetylase (PgdA/CDA1 family)